MSRSPRLIPVPFSLPAGTYLDRTRFSFFERRPGSYNLFRGFAPIVVFLWAEQALWRACHVRGPSERRRFRSLPAQRVPTLPCRAQRAPAAAPAGRLPHLPAEAARNGLGQPAAGEPVPPPL